MSRFPKHGGVSFPTAPRFARFRRRDAAEVESASDALAARRVLAARVAPKADADSEDLDVALEALDPAADVGLVLACPACGAQEIRAFDVPSFVWREFEILIPRILRDVADLARAFHWSERDILDLPPWRRSFYLREVRG